MTSGKIKTKPSENQVGRGQGERHPQGRQQEGRKAPAGKAKSK